MGHLRAGDSRWIEVGIDELQQHAAALLKLLGGSDTMSRHLPEERIDTPPQSLQRPVAAFRPISGYRA